MDFNNPTLYRKRFIPEEKILLKDDEILDIEIDRIITKWNTLKPRKDFSRGYSCYFIDEGIKVSKMIDCEGRLVYYYCDIIETEYIREENTYIFSDLLVDVIVYENGFVKVLDIGEITDALEDNIISIKQAKLALKTLDFLLAVIYTKNFDNYTDLFNDFN